MNTFIIKCTLFLFLIGIEEIQSRNVQKQLHPLAESCMKKLKLNPKEVIDPDALEVIPQERIQESFLECYWKNREWQNQEGDINYTGLTTLLHNSVPPTIRELPLLQDYVSEILQQTLTSCKNKNFKGDTHGETALKIHNCLAGEPKFLTDM